LWCRRRRATIAGRKWRLATRRPIGVAHVEHALQFAGGLLDAQLGAGGAGPQPGFEPLAGEGWPGRSVSGSVGRSSAPSVSPIEDDVERGDQQQEADAHDGSPGTLMSMPANNRDHVSPNIVAPACHRSSIWRFLGIRVLLGMIVRLIGANAQRKLGTGWAASAMGI
jgi:hypothetical protein